MRYLLFVYFDEKWRLCKVKKKKPEWRKNLETQTKQWDEWEEFHEMHLNQMYFVFLKIILFVYISACFIGGVSVCSVNA